MKNRQFWVIVLCFLWLFGLLFVANNNTQKQNLFEKSVMCRNLYWSVSEHLKEDYFVNSDFEQRWVSDIETFYSPKLDTCIVDYKINFIDKIDESSNDNNYIIESVPAVKNEYWLIMACHEKVDTDCYKKQYNKILELK